MRKATHSLYDSGGFTLIELLIVLGFIVAFGGMIFLFQRDFFTLNKFFQESFTEENALNAAVRGIVAELRTAGYAATGAYPIEIAGANSLAFYANVDNDARVERVHYFLSGSSLRKSVVKASGSPVGYSTSTAPESLSTVLTNVVASSTAPLFTYYDSSYAGTSTPLAQPFPIFLVRFVRVNLIVDQNPNALPPPLAVTGGVMIRNLKSN
jgi:type II secretory pathway component PulJ